MKRKAVSNVAALTESDPAPCEVAAPNAKKSASNFSAVKVNSELAAVHSKSSNGVVKGTEVKEFSQAEVLAKELNKGRSLDDVKYLASLMERARQK